MRVGILVLPFVLVFQQRAWLLVVFVHGLPWVPFGASVLVAAHLSTLLESPYVWALLPRAVWSLVLVRSDVPSHGALVDVYDALLLVLGL